MKISCAAVLAFCGIAAGASFGVASVHAEQAGAELPAIETVEQDGRGGFRVNGRPFFPVLLYGAPHGAESVGEFREFGFNVLACHAEAAHDLRRAGFYAAVHGRKPIDDPSSVFMLMGTDSPALYFKKDLLGQTREANAKTAALLANRPVMNAVGYWEDEPEGVYAGRLPSKSKYEELIASIDVAAPYLYPVPYQPIVSVAEATTRARAATEGRKIVLPILQLFAWKAEDRYPSPAELQCMAFLALAEGAGGIGFYTYQPVTGRPKTTLAEIQPELWRSVRDLNGRLAKFALRWREGAPSQAFVSSGDAQVRVVAKQDEGGVIVLAINPTDAKQSVTLSVLTGKGGVELTSDEGVRFDLRQGAAMLELPPHGVAVLQTAAPR